MNKRINGHWIMETNASKKRKAKIEQLRSRMHEIEEKGRMTSKIRQSFLDRIERLEK